MVRIVAVELHSHWTRGLESQSENELSSCPGWSRPGHPDVGNWTSFAVSTSLYNGGNVQGHQVWPRETLGSVTANMHVGFGVKTSWPPRCHDPAFSGSVALFSVSLPTENLCRRMSEPWPHYPILSSVSAKLGDMYTLWFTCLECSANILWKQTPSYSVLLARCKEGTCSTGPTILMTTHPVPTTSWGKKKSYLWI